MCCSRTSQSTSMTSLLPGSPNFSGGRTGISTELRFNTDERSEEECCLSTDISTIYIPSWTSRPQSPRRSSQVFGTTTQQELQPRSPCSSSRDPGRVLQHRAIRIHTTWSVAVRDLKKNHSASYILKFKFFWKFLRSNSFHLPTYLKPNTILFLYLC